MIKDAVMENDFLKNLDATQVREIVESMYPREFEKGSYVIREGDAGKQQLEKNEVQKNMFWDFEWRKFLVVKKQKTKNKKQKTNKQNKHWIWLDFDGYNTSPKKQFPEHIVPFLSRLWPFMATAALYSLY